MDHAATQVASRQFDEDFFRFSASTRDRIQAKLDDLGSRLMTFPHHRLVGSDRYRLRVGDYQVIYRFDLI